MTFLPPTIIMLSVIQKLNLADNKVLANMKLFIRIFWAFSKLCLIVLMHSPPWPTVEFFARFHCRTLSTAHITTGRQRGLSPKYCIIMVLFPKFSKLWWSNIGLRRALLNNCRTLAHSWPSFLIPLVVWLHWHRLALKATRFEGLKI